MWLWSVWPRNSKYLIEIFKVINKLMFYFQKLVLTVKFLFEQILRIFSSLLFFLPRKKKKKLNHFSGLILSSWGEAEPGFVDINSKL